MKFVITIIVSLILFVIIRILVKKAMKVHRRSRFNIVTSLSMLIIYYVVFVIAQIIIVYQFKLHLLTYKEEYIYSSYAGIVNVLWCYFNWNTKFPRFEFDPIAIAKKKTIVFVTLLLFSLYYGLNQANKLLNQEEIDVSTQFYNITVITSTIAWDRVLNQVHLIKKNQANKK